MGDWAINHPRKKIAALQCSRHQFKNDIRKSLIFFFFFLLQKRKKNMQFKYHLRVECIVLLFQNGCDCTAGFGPYLGLGPGE